MTALADDKKTEYREGVDISIPVDDGDTIYAGAMVSVNAAGYAVAAGDTASTLFVGIAREQADNSAGQDGDINVTVRRRGLFKMSFATPITIANVGDSVYIADVFFGVKKWGSSHFARFMISTYPLKPSMIGEIFIKIFGILELMRECYGKKMDKAGRNASGLVCVS